ncbi:WVD2 family protein [Pseudomonas panipatensis]|uniref:Uncharacterized protein n=1 Tax=Pseudomonas panipatensis TaxID=428992 RepID=A0A1G8LY97_9PSED|nr:WVD2 family protein [Pseudomonas panipatensis]SDI60120.1 hypothetical protein SAMN05216272_112131 [Pseudomonas panipatensis]SMP47522.1 hypothetical protein SAMN06295951_102131 [Pseudomonas panipatensis]
MRTLGITLSLLAVSLTAQAESYRLAYSKAENVEVFVDHPDGQPWCSQQLELRFVFAATPVQASIERLMPKLGGLLNSQCGTAASLNWKSFNASGASVASGSASKAAGWVATLNQATPTNATAAAAAPSAAPAVAAPPPAAPAPTSAPVAPVVAATPATPAAPAAPAAAPVAEASVANSVPRDFAVNGWQPPLEEEVLKGADFFTQVQDQNGCRFRLVRKTDANAQYLSAQSTGVVCGPDGYASGAGQLTLMRSDGMEIGSYRGGFHRGIPFNREVPPLPIVAFDGNHNAYLLLHSEPSTRVHYLIQADASWDGRWNLDNQPLIALTDNLDLFRKIETIRSTLFFGLSKLDSALPKTSSLHFYAIRDLPQGVMKNDREQWLYEVSASRGWSSKAWDFNPQYARNWLFDAEAKAAQRERELAAQRQREEQLKREQLAYQAEQQLRLYRELRKEANNPRQLYSRILSDVSYSPVGSSGYAGLVAGGNASVSQIVRISGKSDGGWSVDYPYEALLSVDDGQSSPDKGWFLVKGKVSLDGQKRDKEDLPLTLIAASNLQPCSEDGCADLRDPLKLVRQQVGDDHWTPEAARETVKQAWPDRAVDQESAE